MSDLPGIAGGALGESLAGLPLVLAPALLLFAALVSLLLPARAAAQRYLVPAGSLAAAVVLLTQAGPLFEGKRVLSVVARTLRVGSFDATIVFALDGISFPIALAALASTIWVVLDGGGSQGAQSSELEQRPAAWGLATAAVLVAVLGDALGTWLLASGFGLAAIVLAAPGVARARAWLAGSGLIAIAAGGLFLFWTLGGSWLGAGWPNGGRYLSDYRPRFAVDGANTALGRPPLPREEGRLTITSLPGTTVYLGVSDESLLARATPLGVTPFVDLPVPAGVHKVALVPGGGAMVGGDGLEVALVDAVQVRPGETTRIGLLGPTLRYAEIDAQLGSSELGARRVAGVRALELVGLWFGVGSLALALGAPRLARGSERLGSILRLLSVGALAARFAPWLTLAPSAELLLGLAVLAAAAWFGLRPLVARDGEALTRAPLASLPVLAAALAGAAAVVVATVTCALLLAATASAASRRTLLGAGTAAIAVALAASVSASLGGGLAMGGLGALTAVAAFAAFHGALVATCPRLGERDARALVSMLAVAALGVGVGLWLGAWSHVGGPTPGARLVVAALTLAPVLALVSRLRDAESAESPEEPASDGDAVDALTRVAARATDLLDAPWARLAESHASRTKSSPPIEGAR
jgi:hypothetical protein